MGSLHRGGNLLRGKLRKVSTARFKWSWSFFGMLAYLSQSPSEYLPYCCSCTAENTNGQATGGGSSLEMEEELGVVEDVRGVAEKFCESTCNSMICLWSQTWL